ncbi:hypothetical protein BJV78DRAFT_1289749 [Lactifluus subvellereus]|nr:hypothetical protein BJV78DRAFT_1289749 [Lactifluus subvellereus]
MQEGSKDAPNEKASKGKQKVAGRKATPVTHKDPEPEEGDETDTPKGASRATNLKMKDRVPVMKESEFTSTDSDAEEVVQQKMGRKLKRTYAMREIASSDHDADAQDSDYKSATGASGTEKKAKPAVQEAIRANCVELAGGNMKNRSGSSVAESLIMIGKPSGHIKNWIAHVPQGAPPESTGRPNSAGSIHTATLTTIHLNAHSTKLSNVALVAGKTQASNSEPVGVSLGPGGFEDEDETEEREHALSSPIKGNQRLSSAGIVKVTVGAASPVSRSKHSAANRRKDKYTNSDLPPGCKENNVWRCTLIPTYIQYMSNQKNAWGIQDDDAIVILQGIWDYVYGARVPAKIGIVGPIFAVADQHLCEWHSAFGSAMLMFLNTFFSDSGYDTDEARREFSREALSDYAFLYAKVVRKDGR